MRQCRNVTDKWFEGKKKSGSIDDRPLASTKRREREKTTHTKEKRNVNVRNENEMKKKTST